MTRTLPGGIGAEPADLPSQFLTINGVRSTPVARLCVRAKSASAVSMSSALVYRTGGVVSRLAGDGVMARFGDAPRLAM
jgi:hypothetical protein